MTIAITGAAGHLGRLTGQLVLDRGGVPTRWCSSPAAPRRIADLARRRRDRPPRRLRRSRLAAGRLRRRRPPAADQRRRARQPGGPAHRRRRCRGRRPASGTCSTRRASTRAAPSRWWSPTTTARPSRRSATAACAGPRCATASTPSPRSPRRRAPSPRATSSTTTATARPRTSRARTARAAAAAALTGDGHEDRVYDITGPELVTQAQVGRAGVGHHRAPGSTAVAIDDDEATRGLTAVGLPADTATAIASFGTAIREGVLDVVSADVEGLTGRRRGACARCSKTIDPSSRRPHDRPHRPPFRADHVGSLLRPPELTRARDEHAAGRISAEELRAIEDEAIRDVVRMQEEVGLQSVTDGEFRRAHLAHGLHLPARRHPHADDEASRSQFHNEDGRRRLRRRRRSGRRAASRSTSRSSASISRS